MLKQPATTMREEAPTQIFVAALPVSAMESVVDPETKTNQSPESAGQEQNKIKTH